MLKDHLQKAVTTVMAIALFSGIYIAASQAGSTKSIEIVAEEFEFSQTKIKAQAGQPLEFTLNNKGALAHNITFTDMDAATETIQGDDKTTVTVTFDKPGRYEFVCSVPGHANAGMKGLVIVE